MEDDMKFVGNQEKIKRNKKLKLGKGGFGSVCEGIFDKKRVAVKRMEREEMKEGKSANYENELKIISSSYHQNIIRYLFHDKDENYFYLVMELCSKGSLKQYFMQYGYGMTRDKVNLLQLLYHATSGIKYLHEKRILHRDIKPSNILLYEESNNVTAKVADFGFGKALDLTKSSSVSSAKGSFGYRASEVCLKLRNRPQSDIFSLGIVFHEFSTEGGHPFGPDELKREVNIREKKKPNLEHTPLKELVGKMVDHNWDLRPAADMVLTELVKMCPDVSSPLTELLGKHEILQRPLHSSVFFNQQRDDRIDKPSTVVPEDDATSPKKQKIEEASKQYLPQSAVVSTNTQEKSSEAQIQLRNAESAIFRRQWSEAKEFLNAARRLYEPKGSVTAEYLFTMAEESSKSHLVRSILLYACSSSQCRKQYALKTASFETGTCVFKIYFLAKDALNSKVTCNELMSDVRYKDIVEEFVVPFLKQEYEELIMYQQKNRFSHVTAAEHNGYVSSWISVLLNLIGNLKDCANFANANRKKMEMVLRTKCNDYQSFARLLQAEGEAKSRLSQCDEAEKLLQRTLKVIKRAFSDPGKKDQAMQSVKRLLMDNDVERVNNT